MATIEEAPRTLLSELFTKHERNDKEFRMNGDYAGSMVCVVFKYGAQGLGYYSDISMEELLEEYQ